MGENVNSFLSTIFWGNQSVESGYVIRIDIKSLCHHRSYGSVSAGREKWLFNVLFFFLKAEPPCDQTL